MCGVEHFDLISGVPKNLGTAQGGFGFSIGRFLHGYQNHLGYGGTADCFFIDILEIGFQGYAA
jgi:hypothetical protein